MATQADHQDWPARSWLLFLLGGAAGLLVHWLGDTAGAQADSLRLAMATFIGVAATVFGFTLERREEVSTIIFALVAGIVVASVIYWNGGPDDWDAANGWRLLCAAIAVAIAAPLFQVWRERPAGAPGWRAAFPYPAVHDRAWTNIVLWCLAWAFAGVVMLLALLLSELFQLIGIGLLKDALREDWFIAGLLGASLGAGVGLLRDRDPMLALLQRVAMTVLSVLAPILGAALLLFVLALPFTGLAPLWDATRSTTPILLSTIVAAILLINAVIGDSAGDEAKLPALRWGAMALSATLLPLAVIAAVSTGLRIDQYGLTPDRLWAVVFTAIAMGFAIAYAVALVRRRMEWAGPVRRANLVLVFVLCLLAFALSTPLLSFGALSARDQVARLNDGRTRPETFDWAALWFDFGPAGKRAVRDLAASGNSAEVRKRAREIQQVKNRWDAVNLDQRRMAAETLDRRLTILPEKVALPEDLKVRLSGSDMCGSSEACVLLYRPGENSAVLINTPCQNCDAMIRPVYAVQGRWQERQGMMPVAVSPVTAPGRYPNETERRTVAEAIRQGKLEIRPVERRQLFIDGKPAGQPFE